MKKFSVNSLTVHIWSIFISLIIVIFLCLFIFQNFFYDRFYDFFKGEEVIKIGEQIQEIIKTNDDNYFEEVESIALKDNLVIAVFTMEEQLNVLYNPTQISNLVTYYDLLNELNIEYDVFRESQKDTQDIFIYVTTFDVDGSIYYLYINTPIEGSSLALSINQTLIVISALITMVFGILIAFFFSNYLAKPIRDLNDAAFLLSNGNYDVEFPDDGLDELKQLGTSLNKAKNELMKTDNLQKEFIANVSHDLRTPLTLILSYAEMIRDLSGDNKEKREEHLGVIISEVNRLSSLVTDVLEITKMNANNKELKLEKIDISNLVSNVIEKLKLPLAENKIKLTTTLDKKAFALVDEVAMNQVIYNFILNAITYTKTRIIVTVDIIDDKICFSVTDDGIGIKETEINQIWERYYRSEENHERHKHGSGLGLSIVKKIVENHNFEYGVKSVYNEGSTFYVIIPLVNNKQ